VRDIVVNAAFMGEPAEVFFDDKDILADFLTLYFTDYEPESCFVAVDGARIVGCITGSKNVALLKKIFLVRILPRLLIKAILRGSLLKKKNVIFLFHYVVSLLRQEFRMSDFSRVYPATLHINIEKDYRNLGIGSKLILAYLNYLGEENISGVHFATLSDNAALFFQKQSFDLLFKAKRSYFRYILHRDITFYLFGKKL